MNNTIFNIKEHEDILKIFENMMKNDDNSIKKEKDLEINKSSYNDNNPEYRSFKRKKKKLRMKEKMNKRRIRIKILNKK